MNFIFKEDSINSTPVYFDFFDCKSNIRSKIYQQLVNTVDLTDIKFTDIHTVGRQQFYQPSMYKINDKFSSLLTSEQFSPWEESFINLVKTLKSNQLSRPKKTHYLTLDHNKTHKYQKFVSLQKNILPIKRMEKTSFNTTKINLHSNKGEECDNRYQLMRKQSRKYEGPRLTFYSKMNPKCSEKYKLAFRNNGTIAERSSLSDQIPTNRLIRDSSIHYLDILDDRSLESQLKDPPPQYLLNHLNPMMSKRSSLILSHNHKFDQNMTRFKMLYSTRKGYLKK